jgi:hypothetical protein
MMPVSRSNSRVPETETLGEKHSSAKLARVMPRQPSAKLSSEDSQLRFEASRVTLAADLVKVPKSRKKHIKLREYDHKPLSKDPSAQHDKHSRAQTARPQRARNEGVVCKKLAPVQLRLKYRSHTLSAGRRPTSVNWTTTQHQSKTKAQSGSTRMAPKKQWSSC